MGCLHERNRNRLQSSATKMGMNSIIGALSVASNFNSQEMAPRWPQESGNGGTGRQVINIWIRKGGKGNYAHAGIPSHPVACEFQQTLVVVSDPPLSSFNCLHSWPAVCLFPL